MTTRAKALAKIAIKTFDYADIDPDAKSKLIYLAAEVNRSTTTHIQAAIELGQSLAQAQEILATAGCKGKFASWIELECGFSRATAYRYIDAFTRFSGKELSQSLGRFTLESIYTLAPESVPQLAIDEAVKLANKGTRITKERADEILSRYRELAPKKKLKPGRPPAQETPHIETEPINGEGEDTNFDPVNIEAEPHATVDIAGLSAPYKQSVLEIGAIINRFKKISEEERTGGHIATKLTRIVHDLTEAKVAISEAEPVCVCPKCDGKGCNPCASTGFWTRAIKKSRKSA